MSLTFATNDKSYQKAITNHYKDKEVFKENGKVRQSFIYKSVREHFDIRLYFYCMFLFRSQRKRNDIPQAREISSLLLFE